jgi:hypothetical protein
MTVDEGQLTHWSDIPCCPDLDTEAACDVLDFRRRLVFPTSVRSESGQPVQVEVTFHTRFTRCPGPLALGDLAYSTTLLPGEKVRIATTDRRSRFSFDTETSLSYRSEQMSEEQYRMTALRTLMADENSTDTGSDKTKEQGKWDFHGDASGGLGFFSINADTNAHGSHSGESSHDWLIQHRAHAQFADNQSIQATRMAHSVSVGEVSTRAHQAGESEDHFESSSRTFQNENRCHAVTFLFYRLNKTETIKFTLEAVERRVIDPVAPTPVQPNPFRPVGQISTIPQEVPATAKERVNIEARGLQSEAQYREALGGTTAAGPFGVAVRAVAFELGTQQPLPTAIRDAALAEVDAQLARPEVGLIDKPGGSVSKQAQEEIGFEQKTAIPTAGVIVKGCLDTCDVCEPQLERKIELELQRLDLENQLLKKQIDLLEKSQEYRCCPTGTTEEDDKGGKEDS